MLHSLRDEIYLASFSTDGDLLDQWRAYAADGRGYSIGINPKQLPYDLSIREFLPPEPKLAFVKVKYYEDNQRKLITDFVNDSEIIVNKEHLSVSSTDEQAFIDLAIQKISEIITQIAPYYKHPSFKNEMEWRFVRRRWHGETEQEQLDALKDMQYRTGNNVLKPYLNLDFASKQKPYLLPIKQIYIGPKLRNTNAQKSLRMYLLSLGYTGRKMPKIFQSQIPYQD